jgi:uracil-DNA glycosylase family 4
MAKKQQLDKLQSQIMSDNVCPALATQATQLVFGDGNPDADIVFIGEAPGKNEDLQGKPFVGAAGKFLDTMLDMIGLTRSDVYITNIVKYRPPNNRDPLPEEKTAFLPYLKQQLMIIGPKIIVTLGRHSLEVLLPGLRISEVHGQPKRVRIEKQESKALTTDQDSATWVILPLFHPAAALYNGSMRQTLIDDFARIPTVLERISE